MVATADGDQPIADLAVGDLVYGFDERSGTTGLFTVTAVLVHADPLLVHLTLDNERIETTQEHPFFVAGRGWVAAGDLQVGDAVQQRDGTSGGLLGITLGFILSAVGTFFLQRVAENARAQVQLNAVLLATITSLIVGIVFGLYPAIRASRLNPIDALRYD